MKKEFILLAFMLALIMGFALASASTLDVDDVTVSINGKEVFSNNSVTKTVSVERGSTITVQLDFTANESINDIKAKAEISSYREDIRSKTERFDIKEGKTYAKYFYLDIPNDMDTGDTLLEIEITGGDKSWSKDIDITIQKGAYVLEIKSVEVDRKIEAGKSLLVEIVVKNMGSHEIEDVYVKASIDELDIEKTTYLGDLTEKDAEDGEDTRYKTIVLAIPEDTKTGSYTLEVRAYNSDVDVKTTKTFSVKGVEEVEGEEVVAPTRTQTVKKGKGVVYGLTILNLGEKARTYSISVEGTENWASVQINPVTIKVPADKSQIVDIYVVTNKNAVPGTHLFTVIVKRDGDIIKQIGMTADVEEEVEKKEKGFAEGLEGFFAKNKETIFWAVGLGIIVILLVLALLMKGAERRGELIGREEEERHELEEMRAGGGIVRTREEEGHYY